MPQIISKWHHQIEPAPCSPLEFLGTCAEIIEEQVLPFVKLNSVEHGGGRAGKRIYLRVAHRNHFIDIGAALNGGGLFISLWFVQEDSRGRKIQKGLAEGYRHMSNFSLTELKFTKPPSLLGKLYNKFYEGMLPREDDFYFQDEIRMFYDNIQSIVQALIHELESPKGRRQW